MNRLLEQSLAADILQHLPTGILVTDNELNVEYLNSEGQYFLGLSGETKSLRQLPESHSLTRFPGGESVSLKKLSEDQILGSKPIDQIYLRCDSGEIFSGIAEVMEERLIWSFQPVAGEALDQVRLSSENTELRQFTRAVTHDLKEPLRAITGFLGILEEELGPQVDASVRRLLDFTRAGAGRLDELIGNLAALPLEHTQAAEKIDLNEVFRLAFSHQQVAICEARATIDCQALPTVDGWKEPLVQVFSNLIGNAIKYCDESPRIRITSECINSQWHIRFADNGVGISQEDANKVFLPTVRLEKNRPGTGFGLTICRRAVELHRGQIWVTPGPREGSVFHLVLPAEQDTVSEPATVSQKIDFQQVLESMDDMVLIKGERSRLLWANKTFRDLYAMSNQDLRDLLDGPQSDPDDTVQYVKDDHKVFTEGVALRVSEPVTDHRGETTFYDTVKAPIRNERGRIIQTVGVSRRILDPSEIEASSVQRFQRKEKLDELRVLVRNIPLAIALLDVKERVLAQSAAWESLFDYTSREAIGHFYDDACEPKLPLLHDLRQAASDGQSIERQRVSFESADKCLHVQIQPWRHASGDIGGTVVVLIDVTAIVQSESRLQEKNTELSHFNYRLSHDFLSPLRSIQGLSHVAIEAVRENDYALGLESSERILSEASNLIGLLLNLRKFARTEEAREEPEDVPLRTFVTELFEVRKVLEPDSGVRLKLDLEVESVRLPPLRFQQILEHLLCNALRYRDRKVKVDEIVVTAQERQDSLVFTVTNRGEPIPEELRENIFGLFSRGTASHPGNGLGLYFAHKQVVSLGGSLNYDHKNGETSFEVLIPRNS